MRTRLLNLGFISILISVLVLAGCEVDETSVSQVISTNTLSPIVSLTPRFTSTLVPSRTASPTQSLTPTETEIPPTATESPTPTNTPPIMGSVFSVQAINVRQGPGVNFGSVAALPPGTGFQVLGTNGDGTWYNIRLDNGDEGWVSSTLVRLQPTETPLPSLTPTPNLTMIALGSPLPTSIFGGGTVTPTPPRSVVTPTPIQPNVTLVPVATDTDGGGLLLPNLEAPAQTATALVSGLSLPTNPPTIIAGGPTGGPLLSGTPQTPVSTQAPVNPQARQGIDVLAYCDNRIFGEPPPTNLAVGSTIDVWWRWIATTPELVQQHIDNAIYEVQFDGVTLSNWRQYSTGIRQRSDGQHEIDWLIPSEPLTAGEHVINYRVTWRTAISDGHQQFGPGTSTPVETGSCTFTVR